MSSHKKERKEKKNGREMSGHVGRRLVEPGAGFSFGTWPRPPIQFKSHWDPACTRVAPLLVSFVVPFIRTARGQNTPAFPDRRSRVHMSRNNQSCSPCLVFFIRGGTWRETEKLAGIDRDLCLAKFNVHGVHRNLTKRQ